MKRYLLYFIFVVIAGFLILIFSTSDEFNWFRAKLGNKSTDYAQYMKAHPDGWHYFEAKKRFDNQSWKEVLKAGTIRHFQNYIKENPDGIYLESAKEHIISLEWSETARLNTIEMYEKFIEKYPGSQYVKEAMNGIDEFVWEQLLAERDIEKVNEYIETHPNGERISEANIFLEYLTWTQAADKNTDESYLEYIKLYPEGKYISRAMESLSRPLDAIPIYIDSYHLYELTPFDEDYGYIFENQIKEIVSEIKTLNIVSDISEAAVYLQIGYALSFREGQVGEDNISKFIASRWRDRAIVKQERVKPTFDIGLNLYLWDLPSDCLIAFSSSVTPPETGNAAPARQVGRDAFLNDQVKKHIENSFMNSLGSLLKGKDDIMYLSERWATSFCRPNIEKLERQVFVNFENGPITVFHWRDPSIEKYIYLHLQQFDIDCVRKFDEHSYKLQITWSKYSRNRQANMPLREFGVTADFTIYEKDKQKQDRTVFNKSISSDFNMQEYGLLPIEVINQWRKVFDSTYVMEKLTQRLKTPILNDLPDTIP